MGWGPRILHAENLERLAMAPPETALTTMKKRKDPVAAETVQTGSDQAVAPSASSYAELPDSDDLPPCPFCGAFSASVDAHAYPDNDNPKRWDATAKCGCCSCTVRTGGFDATEDLQEAPTLAKRAALRIWRRRKSPSA
jgi:hypothetical protein